MLQKALQSRDFEQARIALINGEKLPVNDMQSYQLTGIYDSLIRENAFDIIALLIADGTIEMDIYEYDSFDQSIFKSIFTYLGNDEASLQFLNEFLPQIQSLNDELGNKTLVSYALDQEVPIELLNVLIQNGCIVDCISASDENLIHQIVKKYTRNYDRGLSYLQLLAEQGLDLDKPNVVKETPLHSAVKEHRNLYIKWLMENGADANFQNKDGESPLFLATSQGGDTEKYELIRQYATPDFEQVNARGETLFCASDLNHLKVLLEDGADLYQPSKNTYGQEISKIDALAISTAEHVQIALDSGQLDVHRKDDKGNTLLHRVCGRETLHEERRAKEVFKVVKLLLASGADAAATNDMDETPMMIAATDTMKTKTVELLLSHK